MSRAAGARLEGHGLACLRGERLLFARLDFQVEAGEALLLTGANGSGKSSLLRLIAGLLPPLAGSVLWNGLATRGEPGVFAADLHFLAAADIVKPAMSVWENLAFQLAVIDAKPAAPNESAPNESGTCEPGAGDAARAALARVGLGALADLPGRALSTGQRRRLALARLIAAPRPLWLLDEPTGPLDRAGQSLFQALAAAHLAGGGLIVAATHRDLGLVNPRALAPGDFLPDGADADFS